MTPLGRMNRENLHNSETLYRALFEHAPVAIITVDSNGEILSVNAKALSYFGYSRDEFAVMGVEDLVPETQRQAYIESRSTFLSSPSSRLMGAGGKLCGLRKDGSQFPVEISLYPLEIDGENLVVAHIVDISERQYAEEKFRNLLESAPDAMVIVNQQGEIGLVNRQTEKLFGFSSAELLGHSIEILIPQRFREGHIANRLSYFSIPKVRGMEQGLELFGCRKNGEEFPVEISLSPLETGDGVLVSAAIRDITERKAVERDLHDYARQLELRNREAEEFTYIASHDLQEPLRSMSNFAELLDLDYGDLLDADGREYLKHISEASKRMTLLIKGLLEYSRIGQYSSAERVDSNALVQSILRDLDHSIQAAGAEVRIGDLPVLTTYPGELRLLLQNLISNAIKFRRLGVKPLVEIKAKPAGDGRWQFSVKDNGIGISPEFHDRIFKLFKRLDDDSSYEGSGIGLAHCRKIIDICEGDLSLESELGKGATFIFTLPEVVSAVLPVVQH